MSKTKPKSSISPLRTSTSTDRCKDLCKDALSQLEELQNPTVKNKRPDQNPTDGPSDRITTAEPTLSRRHERARWLLLLQNLRKKINELS